MIYYEKNVQEIRVGRMKRKQSLFEKKNEITKLEEESDILGFHELRMEDKKPAIIVTDIGVQLKSMRKDEPIQFFDLDDREAIAIREWLEELYPHTNDDKFRDTKTDK